MHLEASTAFDASRTMTRNLAKDGLMDDGQESLLKRESPTIPSSLFMRSVSWSVTRVL